MEILGRNSESKKGRNVFKKAKKYPKYFKLRGEKVNAIEARKAVMKGRPCLCRFYLDGNQWHNFFRFF